MHIISSLLFSFSANIDNLAVGIAYGIKNLKIQLSKSFIIAFMSCLGTLVSMSFGKLLTHIMPIHTANLLGSIILISFGIWSIWITLKEKQDNLPENNHTVLSYEELLNSPEKADVDKSGYIDFKESLTLGFALAVNNMGMGIGASITGLNVIITSLLTFLFSLIFLSAGCYFGKKYLSGIMGKFAGILSGVIILLLGLYEMFI
jgi:putative sporulation protein YtaF